MPIPPRQILLAPVTTNGVGGLVQPDDIDSFLLDIDPRKIPGCALFQFLAQRLQQACGNQDWNIVIRKTQIPGGLPGIQAGRESFAGCVQTLFVTHAGTLNRHGLQEYLLASVYGFGFFGRPLDRKLNSSPLQSPSTRFWLPTMDSGSLAQSQRCNSGIESSCSTSSA